MATRRLRSADQLRQVYLVAGGYSSSSHAYLATTELLVHGHQSWVHSGALPHAAYGIRAVSLNNHVIATGHIIVIIIASIYCVVRRV